MEKLFIKLWLFIVVLFLFTSGKTNAQFTDRYWTFGDSAGIDFQIPLSPTPAFSAIRTRGSCSSICDSLGNLLFYTASPDWKIINAVNYFKQGYILNKNHLTMQNGDSIKTSSWYQELTIVPNPNNSNQFYVFQLGVTATPNPGLSYSLVDLSYNGGLGMVIQKNIQLLTNPLCDAVAAVKHGNGRDWWLVVKPWNNSIPVNSYYVYLISPFGISAPIIQPIGSSCINSGIAKIKFTKDGSKLFFANSSNVIEYYNFDRCSGILSGFHSIYPYLVTCCTYLYWGLEISPDQSKLYLTSIYQGTNQDSSYLYQFDLNAANIYASKETLAVFNRPNNTGPVAGLLQLGPDGKIYLSIFYDIQDCGFSWLYCDTSSFFTENMNLSVINQPDSLGVACDFQPYSFYLGGHRSYIGLPNNPKYELTKLVGSPCDTLSVGIIESTTLQKELFVYYDSEWQKAFINAKGLTGKKYYLQVFDLNGKLIYQQQGTTENGYFTKDLSMEGFASGMYIVNLKTEKEKLSKKFIKNN